MMPKGEPMQALEISGFETAEGDILTLGRPAASPWMWESWSTSKGAAFGPAARGPFPLYACYDSTVTTASGAMLIVSEPHAPRPYMPHHSACLPRKQSQHNWRCMVREGGWGGGESGAAFDM